VVVEALKKASAKTGAFGFFHIGQRAKRERAATQGNGQPWVQDVVNHRGRRLRYNSVTTCDVSSFGARVSAAMDEINPGMRKVNE